MNTYRQTLLSEPYHIPVSPQMESQATPFRLIPFLGLVAIFLCGFAAASYVRSVYSEIFWQEQTAVYRTPDGSAVFMGGTNNSGADMNGTAGNSDATDRGEEEGSSPADNDADTADESATDETGEDAAQPDSAGEPGADDGDAGE